MTRSPQGKVYKTGGQTKHEQGRIIIIKKRVLRLKCHNMESEAVNSCVNVAEILRPEHCPGGAGQGRLGVQSHS